MYAEVTCTIKEVLEEREGISKTTGKAWHSVTYLAETGGMRPYAFTFSRMMGEGEAKLENGKAYCVSCVVAARQYNGKWYNQVQCVKIN